MLSGCMTYGDLTTTSYSGQNQLQTKSERFYMFFNSEHLDFNYQELGQVKTVSNRTDTETEVLERMAYEAWNNGANAIILIESSTEERNEGTVDLLLTDECEEESDIYYDAVVFEGQAVYTEITDEFRAKYGEGVDMHYVKKVEEDLAKETKRKGGEAVLFLAGGVISIIGLISSPSEED